MMADDNGRGRWTDGQPPTDENAPGPRRTRYEEQGGDGQSRHVGIVWTFSTNCAHSTNSYISSM